jgi:hypothetical protein
MSTSHGKRRRDINVSNPALSVQKSNNEMAKTGYGGFGQVDQFKRDQ